MQGSLPRLLTLLLLGLSALLSLSAATSPAAGPADTVWDLAWNGPQQLIASSSDGSLHKLQLSGDNARPLESLRIGPEDRIKHVLVSPDGKRFACLSIHEQGNRLITGSLSPLRIQAQYRLPREDLEAQSLLWLPASAKSPRQNGLIIVGTSQRRLGLREAGNSLKPVFTIQTPIHTQARYNDSVSYQGQGWTAWSPGGNGSQEPDPKGRLILESWSLDTGRTLKTQSFDPSAFGGDWSLVALATGPRGLLIGLGQRGLDSVLYLKNPQGQWVAKVCTNTSAGGYPRALIANQQTAYVAFQWPGKVMALNLQTMQWQPDLRSYEDPMALALDARGLYVGLRYGGVERYPLTGGKPVNLYISELNQKNWEWYQKQMSEKNPDENSDESSDEPSDEPSDESE